MLSMTNGIYKPSQFYADDGVLCLRMYNIRDGRINFDNGKRIRINREELEAFRLVKGDLLVNRVNSRELVGKAAPIPECPEPLIFESKNIRIRLLEAEVLPRYSNLLFQTAFYRSILEGYAKQACGQATVSQPQLSELPLPLPPLAEQRRIIAKVDELMALCDRLEVARQERERRRHRLTAASLHQLNNGADAEAFRRHTHFYLDHLPRLTACPEHVQQFRQTVLNLAARGQLVPQNPGEESASELLKRIEAEKARLITEGKLRKEKPLPPVAGDEAPFPIPSSWRWARIGTVSLFTEYGTSVKSDHTENGVPVFSMGDIQGGAVILGGQKKVPHEVEDLPKLFLKRLDLLYNRTNSAELVGKTGIYMGNDDTYTFASYLIRIRFLNDFTSPLYANLAMNAPYFRATQIIPELQQQCGQANVNGTKLRNMLIPVPPLAEQHRIVAKVNELMNLCNQLERRLSNTQAECHDLLEAVLHHALIDTLELPAPALCKGM